MVFALVSDRFQPAPNSDVTGSRPDPGVQVFPPEDLRTYALKKDCVFGTFVCLIMFQDKNRVVVPPATPRRQPNQNLMIILKILRICNVNSKINLKKTNKKRVL
jgi:hypothetical protein